MCKRLRMTIVITVSAFNGLTFFEARIAHTGETQTSISKPLSCLKREGKQRENGFRRLVEIVFDCVEEGGRE